MVECFYKISLFYLLSINAQRLNRVLRNEFPWENILFPRGKLKLQKRSSSSHWKKLVPIGVNIGILWNPCFSKEKNSMSQLKLQLFQVEKGNFPLDLWFWWFISLIVLHYTSQKTWFYNLSVRFANSGMANLSHDVLIEESLWS